MKQGIQKMLADQVGVSAPMINMILRGKARPSYDLAKKLSEVVEGTDVIVWLELDLGEIERAIERWNPSPEKAA